MKRLRGKTAQLPGRRLDTVEPATRNLKVVALVHKYLGGRASGAEVMLHCLLRDSAQRGHRATVVTNAPRRHSIDGVTVVPRSTMPREIAQADIIVGHLMWVRELVDVAGRHRKPLVWLAHNESQLRSWSIAPENATCVVWNSQHLAAAGAAVWNGPSSIVRPPVLLRDYRLDRDPWNAQHVTLVNAVPEKGVTHLYELAGKHPGRRFLAVEGGYGNQRHPDRQRPKLRNVLWQPATKDTRDKVYARTRVLLMLSHKESWGRVACEAMCSGIPVIAHPATGLQESLGDAALFVDRADRQALNRALVSLDDEDTYRHWSTKARERAAELDRIGRADLGVWDDTVRRAAQAT